MEFGVGVLGFLCVCFHRQASTLHSVMCQLKVQHGQGDISRHVFDAKAVIHPAVKIAKDVLRLANLRRVGWRFVILCVSLEVSGSVSLLCFVSWD